jgi:hypothetical protein
MINTGAAIIACTCWRGLLVLELTFGFEEQAITPNPSTKLVTKPDKGLSLKG